MPPKKKGKTLKKTVIKKDAEKTGESELETKYQRSVLDVAILKDHLDQEEIKRKDLSLAYQRSIHCSDAGKAQAASADLRGQVRDLEQKLQLERQQHRDVSSDLGRQYKSMQTELSIKVNTLDQEVSQLRQQLALCQDELKKEKAEREQSEQEKDDIISCLRHKLEHMETDYKKILHDTLDSLTSQLCVTGQGWEDQGTAIHQQYKDLLAQFSLNTLDI